MINKAIHFIFLKFDADEKIGGKPFNLIHLLAIKSAKLVNNYDVFLHYENEIKDNIWWEESKQYCTHVKCKSPDEIFGNRIENVALKSDIMRLQILNEYGGIYLDIDTLAIKPLDSFLSRKFAMGQEMVHGEVLGLCNAVLIGEKNSKFVELWLQEYESNYDPRWGYMGVRRPYALALKNPDIITMEPPESFFKYTWTPEDLRKMHENVVSMDGSYVLHLWQQVAFYDYLEPLTVERILHVDTTYNLLARRFL